MDQIGFSRPGYIRVSLLLAAFVLSGAIYEVAVAQESAASEADIRDYIHGRLLPSEAEASNLDVNEDGVVDVADIVALLRLRTGLATLVGNHVGVFYRDGADLLDGQSAAFGQLPLNLVISSESPMLGAIDNSGAGGTGHFSLYFPKELIEVQFSSEDGYDLVFTIEFQTDSPALSPDAPLTREMTFRGVLNEDNPRLLSGTYEEEILGILKVDGTDLPINLTGIFILNLGTEIDTQDEEARK